LKERRGNGGKQGRKKEEEEEDELEGIASKPFNFMGVNTLVNIHEHVKLMVKKKDDNVRLNNKMKKTKKKRRN
jgi:hypothetical protein